MTAGVRLRAMRRRSSLPVAVVAAATFAAGCGAWQSRQNGYETVQRERCKRRHPHARCQIKHIKLLNR